MERSDNLNENIDARTHDPKGELVERIIEIIKINSISVSEHAHMAKLSDIRSDLRTLLKDL